MKFRFKYFWRKKVDYGDVLDNLRLRRVTLSFESFLIEHPNILFFSPKNSVASKG